MRCVTISTSIHRNRSTLKKPVRSSTGYTAIHYDDSVSCADYRTWFVDASGDYFKADNGNSDSIVQVTDATEISTLLSDSGYVVV